MEKKQKEKVTNNNNVTKYGEVIPTNFAWLGLEEQKNRAEKLANIGKVENKEEIEDNNKK